MEFKTVIGLEIHIELATESKIFCGCSTAFGKEPNSQCCPVCLGLPGALPIINEKVVEYGIMAGLALNCKINSKSKMDRKNYFYPDLVKGYQISQYDQPLCYGGYMEIGEKEKKKSIRINRIHIEEDTGKSLYGKEGTMLLDYNRSGIPLIEIVTEPDLNNKEETCLFLQELKITMEYLGISDVRMEEGSLRCDINVNVVSSKGKTSNVVELKNLNSFKAVAKAIAFEEARHRELLIAGKNTARETRRWDEDRQETIVMRGKEEAEDYRYFSEPDLLTISISEEKIKNLKEGLPELPIKKRKRFIEILGLPSYDAEILTGNPGLASFFEEVLIYYKDSRRVSNWILTEVLRNLNERGITIKEVPFSGKQLAELLEMMDNHEISGAASKKIFKIMASTGQSPRKISIEKGLFQIQNLEEIEELVNKVLRDHPQSVEDYRQGKKKAFGYLVGQAMKLSQGKGNPKLINRVLKDSLGK